MLRTNNWLTESEAMSYLQKIIACLRFYQDKRGMLNFKPSKDNQNRYFTDFFNDKIWIQTKHNLEIQHEIKQK